jgi:RNA polymerase sigma-70 factor, ECF subfamily
MTLALAVPRTAPTVVETLRQQFERLYRDSRDDLYAYVATLLGDRSAAEDVTALAFERAFRRRRLYNPRRGSERAWLFGIARNAALDELRRRKRTGPLVGDPVEEDSRVGEDAVELLLRRAAVRAALAGLTPRERELIALKFHGGLSNTEIACVLGVSESNAGTLLHRTITKLRKACDEQA